MFKTKEKKEEFFNLLSEIISIFVLVFLFVSIILTFNKNKEYKKEIAKLIEENNELNGINNELKNLCSLQEEQIELNQIELEKKECLHFLKLIELIKDQDKYVWFQLYYNALFNIYELDDLPETPYDVFTEREITMILKCIETETHEASFDCKVNVANVILNRVESDQFPSDPVELITQKNQFAYGRDDISDSTVYALLYAYMIGSEETNNCIGFRSDKKVENWNDWEYSYYDGVHWFYKLKE